EMLGAQIGFCANRRDPARQSKSDSLTRRLVLWLRYWLDSRNISFEGSSRDGRNESNRGDRDYAAGRFHRRPGLSVLWLILLYASLNLRILCVFPATARRRYS